MNNSIDCECGGKYKKRNINNHFDTKKHKNYFWAYIIPIKNHNIH